MKGNSFRMSLLLGVAAMSTPAVFAQESGEAEARQQTVVVTGTPIRDSQQAAIEAKRDANNVLDVISADTIGRFPDQNLADSLGRLPGLAIERDQGQARYINFRGAPFRYTKIAFDGIDVPGAENGRIPRFDAFPSVITSAVEANKATTPDMPGDSIAGLINVRTFNPFDRDGLSMSAEAGYGEQELGGGPVKKFNGRLSYSGDTFGAVIFGSDNSRMQNTDNREMDLEIDAATDQPIVNELDYRSYFVERQDHAYGGTLEFRPQSGPVGRVFASTLYSEFIDNEQRNQFVFDLAGGAEMASSSISPGATGSTPLALVSRSLEYGRYENSTATHTVGADFDLAGWTVEGRLNYAETESGMYLPIIQSVYGMASASYDVSNVESPILNLGQLGTGNPITVSDVNYAANIVIPYHSDFNTSSTKLKLDAERDTTLFGDTTVKLGGVYDMREADGYGATYVLGNVSGDVDIDSFNSGTPWYTGFNNTIGGTYYDNKGLLPVVRQDQDGFDLSVPDDQLVSIDEDIIALYAMGTTRFNWGNFVYGARVEMTDYSTDGSLVSDTGSVPISYSDDYVTFLPSAHLNFDLTDDLKLRLSATTGISRPNYSELRAAASVNYENQEVSGGNPTLDPEKTWGGDISMEWYYAPGSLLSVGAFYRHVDDVIYSSSTTIDGGVYVPEGAGEDWTLFGYVNGKEGHFSGLEMNFIGSAADLLPEPFDGFGVSGNLTLIDSEFEANDGEKYSLPGTSEVIYNASIYYEKFGFSARLNYQYRDDWLSTTENDSLSEYWGEQQRVDASLRYNLPFEMSKARFTLFANGNNLTDETDTRYIHTSRTPNQVEAYGRYWLVGIRVDY